MRQFLLLLILLLSSTQAFGQSPTQKAEEFLARVPTSSDSALDDLFAGSGLSEMRPQDLMTLKGQVKMAMGLYGSPLGVEKIRDETISPSLVRLVYLQNFSQYPVAWEFYFYKPKDAWVINTINFKDQIAPLIGAKQ